MVTVKRVMDPYAKVRPLPDGTGLDTANVKFEINPFDEIALEEGARIKERDPSAELVAISIGGQECEEQLRKALAMGADRAILVETTDAMDSPAIATELAVVASEIQPQMILMGKQATDDDNNQAGQMLAALLGWPQATFASRIEFVDKGVRVTRETDDGEETLEMPLPCVVTTDLRLNEPRYIALPGIIKARSKPIDRRSRATSQQPRTRVVRFEAVPPRKAGKKCASVEELVADLRAAGAPL